MKTTIFEHEDYKKYLKTLIAAMPSGGRGVQTKMAEHLGCQNAYISQIFNGSADFSLEQAQQLNEFFSHSPAEADYFLLLIQFGRAGTAALQQYFKTKVKAAAARNLSLKKKMGVTKNSLDLEGQMIYYSQWYYAAIHVLLSIPVYQTRETIAQYLQLPEKKVGEVLAFLVSAGLATHELNRYKIGQTRIFIDKDSHHVVKHHSNWRIKALSSLDNQSSDDLHYSSVVTLSQDDAAKLRKMFVEFLSQVSATVRESKEECLRGLCVDFFRA